MKLALPAVCVLLALCPVALSSETIGVPGDFDTIQEAIMGASSGDTILVEAGTYVENIDFLGKSIALRSASGPSMTTIDGDGLDTVVSFVSGESRLAVLEGFTITNGWAFNGGGILCFGSSPTLRGNRIFDNTGEDRGGGISCEAGSAPFIVDSTVEFNVSLFLGAGIFADLSQPEIRGCFITLNNAGPSPDLLGGGVAFQSSDGSIRDSVISQNFTTDFGGGLALFDSSPQVSRTLIAANYSGGVYCADGSAPVFTDSSISDNINEFEAGGVHSRLSSPSFYLCEIVGNSGSLGGGLSLGCSEAVLEDCLIADNSIDSYYKPLGGAGIFSQSSTLHLRRCTITANRADLLPGRSLRGGGLLMDPPFDALNLGECGVESRVAVEGSIIWGNFAAMYPDVSKAAGSLFEPGYSDIGGSGALGGPGLLDTDPLFEPGYFLASDSPCIDAGNPLFRSSDTDLSGHPRLLDGDLDGSMVVDMGALEYGLVRLRILGEPVPGNRLDAILEGEPGPLAVLVVGLEPGAQLFDPYGPAYIAPGSRRVFSGLAALPYEVEVPVSANLPVPLDVIFQAFAMGPVPGTGNTSNAVVVSFVAEPLD